MRKTQFWNTIFQMFCYVVISIMIGALIMISVYALPTEPMFQHVKESAVRIEREGKTFPSDSWVGDLTFTHTKLNSWSDHIMLMQAIYPVSGSVIREAMLNRRWLPAKSDVNMTDTLIRNLNENMDENIELNYQQIRSTDGTIDVSGNSIIYPRYWHGYLTILKPLLMIANVSCIRLINYYFQCALMVTAIILFYKKLGVAYVVAFTIVLLTLNPVTLAMTFQLDAVVYIMLLSVILCLWKNEWLFEKKLYPLFFLFIGILTAFFDFFTFPLVGFGIPWLVYCILNKHHYQGDPSITNLCFHFFCWAFGYAGMWCGKWFVSWFLTGYNVFYDAYLHIGHRISHTNFIGEHVTPFEAVAMNCAAFLFDPLAFAFLVIYICYVYYVFRTKKIKKCKQYYFPVFIVACCPFFWYMLLCNHSYISLGETYRHLVVTMFAALCLIIEILQDDDGVIP